MSPIFVSAMRCIFSVCGHGLATPTRYATDSAQRSPRDDATPPSSARVRARHVAQCWPYSQSQIFAYATAWGWVSFGAPKGSVLQRRDQVDSYSTRRIRGESARSCGRLGPRDRERTRFVTISEEAGCQLTMMGPLMSNEKMSVGDFLAAADLAANLFATVERTTAGQIRITPWVEGRGCLCEAALELPDSAIASVTPTDRRHSCCGKALRVVQVEFAADHKNLTTVFEQLSTRSGHSSDRGDRSDRRHGSDRGRRHPDMPPCKDQKCYEGCCDSQCDGDNDYGCFKWCWRECC